MEQKFFVPYETAVKLKAAGYPQFNINRSLMYGDDYYYDIYGVITKCGYGLLSIYCDDFGAENDYVLAPTYHEAVDWLESKGVQVWTDYDGDLWWGLIASSVRKTAVATISHATREEALNAAILKALEVLQ